MRKFLKFPAVEDEPVRCKMVLGDQTLHSFDEVRKEGICWFQVRKGTNGFFRHEDDVEGVSRSRMK